MRDIKLRAWIRDEQMVEVLDINFMDKFIAHRDLYEHFVYTTELEPKDPDCVTDLSQTILMQYTDLKDKDENPIYEGDILKHDLWGKSIVVWEHGMFRGQWSDDRPYLDVVLSDHQLHRTRVIGNIYENPELLK